jgi:hypothetical protein
MCGCHFNITVISEDLLDCEELVEAIICAISILFSFQITSKYRLEPHPTDFDGVIGF